MKAQALGFIETRGYNGIAAATDAMNETAAVDFIRQEHIGSGFVTTIVGGKVDDVEAAVDAGKVAARPAAQLLHAASIPRIHPAAYDLCIDWKRPSEPLPNSYTLGLIEARGFVPMIIAADAAAKTSEVALTNYYTVGSGFCIIVLRGEMAGVQSAVEAGCFAAERVGKVVAHQVIPHPHAGLEDVFKLGGSKEKVKDNTNGAALGFIETKGLVTLISSIDAALKSASVKIINYQRIGSGITSAVFRGEVSSIRTAIQAGLKVGESVGEVLTSNVIPFPHQALFASNE
jgi:carbon dioxide concentrating mechanism protein CcmO